MPVISIKQISVGYYEIEHTIEPLPNKTLLQERGLVYNLKNKRKQLMTEKYKETSKPLADPEQSEKDKKDMENFVNALHANAVKSMKSLR